MKKRLLTVALALGVSASFAQDLKSKKGENYLPEAGDYALGFDGVPVLNYFGAFLSGAGATAPTPGFVTGTSPMTIMGKYFVDANTAYRGQVRIGFGSTSMSTLTDTSSTGTPSYVEDVAKTSYNAITLGAGLEKRKGNTRIQGFYGGEALIMLGGTGTSNEYGAALSATNDVGPRVLSTKAGSTFGLTLRGFIGAEVFVFPKVSVSGEFGWGLGLATTGEGEVETEDWSTIGTQTTDQLNVITAKTGKSSSFGIDTDNTGGRLAILFHF